MVDRNENGRQLVEMAVTYGRKRQSPQTGYLHYCYGIQDDESHLTIPVVENFLFALALLRTRLIDNVTEGKRILECILHFQNPLSGNFPIYLHEYPQCNDRFTGLQVSQTIFWILKQYHQGLGQELKTKLEVAFLACIRQALAAHELKPAAYHTALKIAATAKAGAEVLGDATLAAQGSVLLDQLQRAGDCPAWYCTKSMGQMCAALMMVYARPSESPWRAFWEHLGETWHRGSCSYVGPAFKEWQSGYEPQVNLYDMVLGFFAGSFSGRALRENVAHLEAMLIPMSDDVLPIPAYPLRRQGNLSGTSWTLFHGEKIAYSLIKKGGMQIDTAVEKGFHPFRMVWGDSQRVHTLACQSGNCTLADYQEDGRNLTLAFELGEILELEDREKSRDVAFYLDVQDKLEFLVADHQSSTFRLEESLSIRDQYFKLAMEFKLMEGEGRFLGHRMLGNRPCQLDVKGKYRYNAYDWQLFLRTVGRSSKGRINVSLQINDG